MAVSGFGFALVLTRLDAARSNVVFRWASLIAGALGLFGCDRRAPAALQPIPRRDVRSKAALLINALLIAYALPALIAAALWLAARRVRPPWYSLGAAVAAAALIFAYVFLQLRVFFHGAAIGYDEGFTLSELGIDASICLALALLLNLSGARGVAGNALPARIVHRQRRRRRLGPRRPGKSSVFRRARSPAALFSTRSSSPTCCRASSPRCIARRLGAAAMRIAAILWGFAYVTLETRRAFNDAVIGIE